MANRPQCPSGIIPFYPQRCHPDPERREGEGSAVAFKTLKMALLPSWRQTSLNRRNVPIRVCQLIVGMTESPHNPDMFRHRCPQHHGVYSSEWWSIDLPSGWTSSDEIGGVSFRRESHGGVLHVSAVRKPDGSIVDDDFSEFIGESKPNCETAMPIRTERCSGFTRDCAHSGTQLTEWWLAHGCVLVYLTFARTADTGSSEPDEVRRIIESLRIKEI